MCGILFILNPNSTERLGCFPEHQHDLRRRGPDRSSTRTGNCSSTTTLDQELHFSLQVTILQLRGQELTHQPVEDKFGNLLAWNGEIFQIDGEPQLSADESDTFILSRLLEECDGSENAVFPLLNRLRGPFALIYYSKRCNCFFFARDCFGRRSLIWILTDSGHFLLSSLLPTELIDFETSKGVGSLPTHGEVPAHGMFTLRCSNGTRNFAFYPWISAWNSHQSSPGFDDTDLTLFRAINTVNIVDHHRLPTWNCREKSTTDLGEWPNQISGHLESLLTCPSILKLVESFQKVLFRSVQMRTENRIQRCRRCSSNCCHAKLAILFSGGIDSMCIARLVQDALPPSESVDLLNVAFVSDEDPGSADLAPDRITGINGYKLLSSMFPQRKWQFVKIDVTKSEMDDVRRTRLWKLITPHESVLDCSLGTALWFASRGEGQLFRQDENKTSDYVSQSRVVFSGLGADELLGGYSRHRTRFKAGGMDALEKELVADLKRIGSRNCGRDDRVISDHGREARYPFLDENVVEFLTSLPLWAKCDLRLPRGVGDKLLLRLLAMWLGLTETASLEKRAMQFGTRIAKLDRTKNGRSISEFLREPSNSSQSNTPAVEQLIFF